MWLILVVDRSDQVTRVGVDDLLDAVGADANDVAAALLIAVGVGREETTLAVGVPDHGAADAACLEVTALDVGEQQVAVAPHGLDIGSLPVEGDIDRLAGDDDLADVEGLGNGLGGDVGTALGGVEEAVEVGLQAAAPLDEVPQVQGEDERVGLLSDVVHRLDGGVEVGGHVHGVQVGVRVGRGGVAHREGVGVEDRVGDAHLVVEHDLAHAILGGDDLGVEEVLHPLLDHVVDALLMTVLLGLVVVPLEADVALVVGAALVALLALLAQQASGGDAELGIAPVFHLALIDGQHKLSDELLVLVNRLHEDGGEVDAGYCVSRIIHSRGRLRVGLEEHDVDAAVGGSGRCGFPGDGRGSALAGVLDEGSACVEVE